MVAGRPSATETPLAGLRIVVADDQEDSRELIGFLLTKQGAVVTGAASAAEAFAAVKGHPPDVLLSDIEMPDESGYAFIGRVRALSPEEGGAVPAAPSAAWRGRACRGWPRTPRAPPISRYRGAPRILRPMARGASPPPSES